MIQSLFRRLGPRLAAFVMLAALSLTSLVALSGCASNSDSGPLHHLTVGLTYIPNIQVAPFYVAEALGYYKSAGLDVTLRHHGFTEGEFDAISTGRENAIFAGGDEILQARSKGITLKYVAEVYTQYPVALIVPANSPIQSAADLRGHSIGIPGAYGTSYIALLALLQSAGLSKSDVNIQTIGFTQPAALLGHKVDAVIDYVNDGVTLFQKANFPVRTIPLQQPLVSNGIAALDSELSAHASDIKALVKATLEGVQYTIAHPQKAVQLSEQFVPGLNDPAKAADALAVLQATIPLWQRSDGKPLGYTDPSLWQQMNSFLQAQGQLAKPMNVTQVYSNAYLPS